MDRVDSRALSVELAALALRALAEEYDAANEDLFGGALNKPPLRLSESSQRLGQWCSSPREISLSRGLVTDGNWGRVVEVLKHEMAHQFVQEVLAIDERPHGPAFQGVCEQRGIDAAAAGEAPSPPERLHIWEKVTRLLSLAQSANENEAEAAMSAAQRLMLRHNLDRVSSPTTARYCSRQLGTPTGRVPEYERVLAALLGEFFFVEVLWVNVWRVQLGKAGSVLEVCGTRENVELAEYVHGFLLRAAGRLWREHKRSCGITGNRDRRRYVSGVMGGFYRKLQGETKKQQESGLVWCGDPQLRGFFRARHPRIERISYGSRPVTEAYLAGRRAGADIVLHRGVKGAPSAPVRQLE